MHVRPVSIGNAAEGPEFAYCRRRFFYEWVEGLSRRASKRVEGATQLRRVDAEAVVRPGRGGRFCLGDRQFMVLRLTVTVIYCPCDPILPLQGGGEPFPTPAEPQIRQH